MQAPIGPAATPALAAAVCEAGGIGSLGASWTEPAALRAQIGQIRKATERPFCVNLVLAFDQEERLEVAVAEGVEVLSFSWGIRSDLVSRAHAGGCLVVAQAGTPDEAAAAVDAGCDAIIAQGVEAGGHVQSDDRPARPGRRALAVALGSGHRGRGHRRRARRTGRDVGRCRGRRDGNAVPRHPGGGRPSRLGRAAGGGVGGRHGAHRGVRRRLAGRAPPGPPQQHLPPLGRGGPPAGGLAAGRARGRRASAAASRSSAMRRTSPGARPPAIWRRCASTPARAWGS